jgi:hypothetical protein
MKIFIANSKKLAADQKNDRQILAGLRAFCSFRKAGFIARLSI